MATTDFSEFSDVAPVAGFTDIASDGPSQRNAKTTYNVDLDGNSLAGNAELRTVDDFVATLDTLGVEGPLTLHILFTEDNKLGEGAQVSVWAGFLLDSSNCEDTTLLDPVAIKRCMFTIQHDKRLDLASPKSRRQVHDMYLEVMALRHEKLRVHRNVVRLLGWGIQEVWHETPLLVLERAISDLSSLFTNGKAKVRITSAITQQLSIDVGHGLDAIHEAGLIHGDIKPQNVLVFENFSSAVPLVAKLADFGLSVGEVRASMGDTVEVSGMSADWCAPEVKHGARLSTSQLIKADNFSYGLLALSVNCLHGKPPLSKEPDAALDTVRSCSEMPPSLSLALEMAVLLLLQEDASLRPPAVGHMLKDESEACHSWERDEDEQLALFEQKDSSGPHLHPWRLPSLAAFLFIGLEKSYLRYRTWMTGPQLFAMFLLKSYVDVPRKDKRLQMEILLDAANKGHVPAQAVVSCVEHSYNIPHERIETFLFNGASHGSRLAMRELEALNSTLALEAGAKFRASTGFNQFYSPVGDDDKKHSDGHTDADANTYLHFLAARGKPRELRDLLLSNKSGIDINARNAHGETALYKACLTGCWESVRELCQQSADAAIPGFLNDLTCLHWLFNFPATAVNRAAEILIDAGADVNALASPLPSVMDYHFPCSWPSGTPLHFATWAQNATAVTALLKRGAQSDLRNGRDPYLSDENVRQLHCHGTTEEGEFSEPDKPPLGLSPVDLAAALHDATMLSLIQTHRSGDEHFTPDEEGYTPFHRLSYLRIARTYHGLRFWYPAFTGQPAQVEKRLVETIEVLISMGGDIDQLTNTPSRPGLKGVSGLSPLHIAVTKSDCNAVAALLKCGADPNKVNRDGRSPLTLLTHVNDPYVTPDALPTIVRLLVKYNAEVNHRSIDGITPLGAAVGSGSMPCLRALLEAGADADCVQHGLNVIAELVHQSSYQRCLQPPCPMTRDEVEAREQDIVSILRGLDVGSPGCAWVSRVDMDNGSLLHYAARSGLADCVALLIGEGLDVNCVRKLHFNGVKPTWYSDTAGYMPAGTPLDIVERQRDGSIQQKRDRLSEEGKLILL